MAIELSTCVRVIVHLISLVAMRIDRFADHPLRGGGLVEGDLVSFM